MHKMNPARVDREDERKMLPCRNFLDGFCPRGHRCRFYHPIPSSLPTVIRVPNLPSSFQQNCLYGQYSIHGGHHSLFSPSGSRSYLGFSPKVGSSGIGSLGTPGGGNRYLSGLNGLAHTYGGRSVNLPSSPTYSEYEIAYAQEMEIQKEKERRAAAPPQDPDEITQNTVFTHIDWKEFLAPGSNPPPPTHVPFMSGSPSKHAGDDEDEIDSLETLIRSAGSTKIASPVNLAKAAIFESQFNTPPHVNYNHPVMDFISKKIEHSTPTMKPIQEAPPKVTQNHLDDMFPNCKGMSAKEELQLKVKQIAKELANEPAQHVQSLDTFFRNYTFQSIPTPPSSEQDLMSVSAASKPAELHDREQVMCENANEEERKGSFDKEGSHSSIAFNPKVPAFTCSSDSGMGTSNCGGNSRSSVESDISSDVSENVPSIPAAVTDELP